MTARALFLALSLLFAARPAFADAPADPIARAKELFTTATEQYSVGKFEDALAGYEQAYQLYKAPAFLFNIAQCHFQLRRWDKAEFFFEGYLREVPNAPNRALVEDLIKEARDKAASDREAEKKRLDLEQQRLEMERQAKEREAAERIRLAAQARPIEVADKPVYKKWWFWGVVGGVVAGTAITIVATSGDTRTVLPEGSLGTWDRR